MFGLQHTVSPMNHTEKLKKSFKAKVSYWSFLIFLYFFLRAKGLRIESYCKWTGHTVDCSTSHVVSSDGSWARKWAPTSVRTGKLLVHINCLAYGWMDRVCLFRACSVLFMYSFCGCIYLFFCVYAALFLFGLLPASSALWEVIYIYKVCLLAFPKMPQ